MNKNTHDIEPQTAGDGMLMIIPNVYSDLPREEQTSSSFRSSPLTGHLNPAPNFAFYSIFIPYLIPNPTKLDLEKTSSCEYMDTKYRR